MSAGGQNDVRREGEADAIAQPPGVRREHRVVERLACERDVLQLDVFVLVVVAGTFDGLDVRRMIHDLGDHNRADLRTDVGLAERGRGLGGVLNAVARDVAAEGDSGGLRAVVETVNVARQVRAVSGEQVNLLAPRTEIDRAAEGSVGVKDQVAVGGYRLVVGDAVPRWGIEIVGQVPAAHIHRRAGGVEQFDGVHRRGVGIGEDFVDDDGRGGHCTRVIGAGRAEQFATRPPTRLQAPRGGRQVFVHNLQGEAGAVGRRIPVIAVFEVENWLTDGAFELDVVARITQAVLRGLVSVGPGDERAVAIAGSETRHVRDHDARLAARKSQAREVELNAAPEAEAGHVEGRSADVLQLEVLEVVRVVGGVARRGVRRVIHDLRDAQRRGLRGEVERAGKRAGPRARNRWVERTGDVRVGRVPTPGEEPDAVRDGDSDGAGVRKDVRPGRNAAPGQPRIGAIEADKKLAAGAPVADAGHRRDGHIDGI